MSLSTNSKSLFQLIAEAANDLFQPARRLSVPQAAAKFVYLNNPGGYIGPFSNEKTPYLVEPAQMLTSPDRQGCIFVGPAQSGKTQALILNWLAHTALIDPMDMMIVCPTNAAARDFSTRRIDRLHRHSETIGAMLLRRRSSDNKFDKHYRNGVMLSISWPAISELAGRPIGRVAITDYDRIADDIDGEGSAYDLASERSKTFKSFAMTLAESSPSREITDPLWMAGTPHEAPPCTGILALYNRGDRRRWQWPCPFCNVYFEGEFEMLEFDPMPNAMDAADSVRMICPMCGHKIEPHWRDEMQMFGTWVPDGCAIDSRTLKLLGKPERSLLASYWLKGVAAGMQTWQELIALYLNAEAEFERTGDEANLRKVYNTDVGVPYRAKALGLTRLPEILKSRADTMDQRVVPEHVRFLVATVDVQTNLFVVQVFGISPGMPFDMTVIDRYQIRKSKRLDEDGERSWVKPGTYLADWDLIEEYVMNRTYPLATDRSRRMMVKMTGCDSGGKAGVTTNAYNFYRKLRGAGKHKRFHLIKGESLPKTPRTRISFPDSSRRDMNAVARGDVPVLFLNANVLKDTLATRLECLVPGKGMIRYPNWLEDWWYAEMCAETRTDKGWENPSHTRNEAWDLTYYALGLCISSLLGLEKFDWVNPPGWAAEQSKNLLVTSDQVNLPFAKTDQVAYDFAKLGQDLAA